MNPMKSTESMGSPQAMTWDRLAAERPERFSMEETDGLSGFSRAVGHPGSPELGVNAIHEPVSGQWWYLIGAEWVRSDVYIREREQVKRYWAPHIHGEKNK